MTASAGAPSEVARAREVVAQVLDPEVPVVTIEDLGVLRDVRVVDGCVEVTITPTYSGCPAMDAIRRDIEKALLDNGFLDLRIETQLSPAWTTDSMSDIAREKLRSYGIAPPPHLASRQVVPLALTVRCPHCASPDTREVSRFGSTACKSLWSCHACLEPFDHFKVL